MLVRVIEGIDMEIIYKKTKELKEYDKNPRNNDEAVEYVANSIKEFGFKNPIILSKDNVIIAGHTRLKAAKKLGIKEVPCIMADDLTDEQVKAFRLADNKVGEIAEWDLELLDLELIDIDMDMIEFGFEFDEDENYGTDFDLPNEGKSEICQMAFTLHEKQKELIEFAINTVKDNCHETFGNINQNGNALYEVIREWAEQRR